jgi:hypothetical protein
VTFHVHRPDHVPADVPTDADRIEGDGEPYEVQRRESRSPYDFQLSRSFSDFVDWVQTLASCSGTPVWGKADDALVMDVLTDAS